MRQAAGFLFACTWLLMQQAIAQNTEPLPSFEQLEAEGAVIGEVRIDNQNIFDLDDPKENNVLFRLANTLHIRTRPRVIRRALLFKSGEPVSVQLIEETERLLRESNYLYDVTIRPIAYQDGVVDIEVTTRDTWTLDLGLGFTRKGGDNETKYGLEEYNLFGTGIGIGWQRTIIDEGTADQFEFQINQLFGTRARLGYSYEERYDGKGQLASLVRPFYAAQYRRDRDLASVFGGWSKGLIDGWTRRYSAGLDYLKDDNELVPGQPPPTELPQDEVRVSPFVRYEVIEDNFTKTKNRDQVERAEYFLLGFRSNLKLGYAATALGSTRPAWSYVASVSDGWEMPGNRILVMEGAVAGVYADSQDEDQLISGSVEYYVPQSKRAQTYIGLAVDVARDVYESNQLTLGGENGLPGYPDDYQSGNRRVLLNVEQRLYSDWFPFRLLRVGGAVFFDVGRAWGGEATNTTNPGWLSNIGFGLRLFSVRSAFGTVWCLDFAFPINPTDDIPDHQVLIYSKRGF
jgi:outer membrane protein assembly factor BamA